MHGRNIAVVLFLVLCLGRVSADPVTITVLPKLLCTFSDIKLNDLYVTMDQGQSIIRPIFVGESGGMDFVLQEGIIKRFSTSFRYSGSFNYSDPTGYSYPGPIVANDRFTLVGSGSVVLLRINDTYKMVRKEIPIKNAIFVALIDDFVLYCDYRAKTMTYYSVTLKNDWTFVERNHEETMKLAESGKYGLSVKDGTIYYKGLELRGVVEQFDDDGNQYSGQVVRIESRKLLEIYVPDGFRNVPVFFDPEGNLYVFDYTRDKEKHPMLYYAGRDWGYREAPRSAVTTEGGLRIRLRANTDAFIIGTMGDQEPITILKTGKSETLGGLTAPWYRIKTADGTIGWAFGGYIRVTE